MTKKFKVGEEIILAGVLYRVLNEYTSADGKIIYTLISAYGTEQCTHEELRAKNRYYWSIIWLSIASIFAAVLLIIITVL